MVAIFLDVCSQVATVFIDEIFGSCSVSCRWFWFMVFFCMLYVCRSLWESFLDFVADDDDDGGRGVFLSFGVIPVIGGCYFVGMYIIINLCVIFLIFVLVEVLCVPLCIVCVCVVLFSFWFIIFCVVDCMIWTGVLLFFVGLVFLGFPFWVCFFCVVLYGRRVLWGLFLIVLFYGIFL